MNKPAPSPVDRAIAAAGSATALAQLLQVSAAAVGQWKSGARPIPVRQCVAIEAATSGAVSRRDLRPNDWQSIWPELAEAKVGA